MDTSKRGRPIRKGSCRWLARLANVVEVPLMHAEPELS